MDSAALTLSSIVMLPIRSNSARSAAFADALGRRLDGLDFAPDMEEP